MPAPPLPWERATPATPLPWERATPATHNNPKQLA